MRIVTSSLLTGHGEVHLTIRTWGEEKMAQLLASITSLLEEHTTSDPLHLLTYSISYSDVFVATESTQECVDVLECAATSMDCELVRPQVPMKWGEDFGCFTQKYRGAFFGIGAGVDQPALHNEDYDYPDELLGVGIGVYVNVLRHLGMMG
jgi:metal-dependent amidase/aminoacylase/carboxypeptidase family protein